MPKFDLTSLQHKIVISFLFEPVGYLDVTSVALGQSFRDAYFANRSEDLLQWYRDNGGQGWTLDGSSESDDLAKEVALFWWIWQNHSDTIAVSNLPVEKDDWITFLTGFITSINNGFVTSPQHDRDVSGVRTLVINNNVEVEKILGGLHLFEQRRIYLEVKAVLEAGT